MKKMSSTWVFLRKERTIEVGHIKKKKKAAVIPGTKKDLNLFYPDSRGN